RRAQANGGGEGRDVEVRAAADFVELERVADDRYAHAGDDLVRVQIEFLVAEIEVVDVDGAGAAVQFELRAGDEEIRQRVADGRTVGDVAGQRAGVLDLRRAEDVEDAEELGDARLDERLERGEGDVRASDAGAVLFAQFVEAGHFRQ